VEIVQGLIDGIGSMFGALGDKASDLASVVTDRWPLSPAKKGPLRTHRPEVGGANIAKLFAMGIEKQAYMVARASDVMAGQVVMGAQGGHFGSSFAATKRGAMKGSQYNVREGDIIVHAYQEEGIERKLERAQFRQRTARENRR
jgi:hypothetical protein